MAGYSNAELTDMHFMYGRANGNATEARRLYVDAYPNRQIPSQRMFGRIHQRLRDTGSLSKQCHLSGRPRSVSTPRAEEEILALVEQNPGTSVRRISAEVGISGPLVWRILHEQLLYPYHVQRVQALNPINDHQARLVFCRWFLRHDAEDPRFLANILFTDEAGFTRNGVFNFHNTHIWADENPHALIESGHQARFSLNIWMGIVGDRFLGPVVLPNRLTGAAYLNFLQNTLYEFLEDIPLNQRQQMWFQHDGAPAHFSMAVREHLHQTFPHRWVGRAGPVLWPPRSPDLNPLDFFVWGYLKTLVYGTPVNSLEELQLRINQKCQEIQTKEGVFERVRISLRRRCRACLEMDGGHFEHLL
jgi:Transposase.